MDKHELVGVTLRKLLDHFRTSPESFEFHGREDGIGSDGPLAPDCTGGVTEHRIREHANAVDIDKDGRMAEKRQPITHVASSCLRTLPRLTELGDPPGRQTAGRPNQTV